MKVVIDGKECEAQYGEYILDVARRYGIEIPTLCHSDALPGLGSCRLCIVEVIERGRSRVVTSCIYPITREAEVLTKSDKILKMRRTIVMLLAARAPKNEYMNKLKEQYGVADKDIERFNVDDKENCILCGLCVKACEEVGTSAISTVNRGVTKKVSTPYDEPSAFCIGCGACSFVCPTGAIKINDNGDTRVIWGKTFKMLKCEECGEYFSTKEQYEYAQKGSQIILERNLCNNCKKKLKAAEKLKDIYKNII